MQRDSMERNGLMAVSVCRPGKWGNPFRVGTDRDPEEAVNAFEWWINEQGGRGLLNDLHELRGKNLACFCPLDMPCHADVLLCLANVEHEPRALASRAPCSCSPSSSGGDL